MDLVTEKNASEVKIVNPDDDSTSNDLITRSPQILNTELLDYRVEIARNAKNTLVSAMDSVASLIREVECKEKLAQQATDEAAQSSLPILANVEKLKQARQLSMETNEMHTKKIHAQRNVLATELDKHELSVAGLLNEGDKSVGVLDEIRRALEIRLISALMIYETAKKVKLVKEAAAQKTLDDEEQEMEKVVEESKRLKQETMEMSKFQEFVKDHGDVIDTLRGFISGKFRDVNQLKEEIEQEKPLSEISSIITNSSSPLTTLDAPFDTVFEINHLFE